MGRKRIVCVGVCVCVSLSVCVCLCVCVLGVRDQEARKLDFLDWDLIFLGLFVFAVFSGMDACSNIPMHQRHQ